MNSSSIVLTSILLLTSNAKAVVLTDLFNDNSTNPHMWSTLVGGVGPTIQEVNQQVEIALPAYSHGSSQSVAPYGSHDFGAAYISQFTATGDFDTQIEFNLLGWPVANGVRIGTGLDIFFTAAERVSFGYASVNGEVYLTHFYDGVQGIIPTTASSGTLRVVRIGNQLSGFFKEGLDWKLIHTGPGPTGDGHLSLAVWSHDYEFGDKDVLVAFDNFSMRDSKVPDNEPTPHPLPIPEPSTYIAGALLLLPFGFQGIRAMRNRNRKGGHPGARAVSK